MSKNLKNLKRIGIDTNVFIYYFEQNPNFGVSARQVFDVLSSHVAGVTSIIALIEILSPSFFSKIAARETEKKFSEVPNLTVLEVNRNIATQAAAIRRQYGFRLPDAIQLATALIFKAQAFITNDKRLKSFKKLKVISLQDLK